MCRARRARGEVVDGGEREAGHGGELAFRRCQQAATTRCQQMQMMIRMPDHFMLMAADEILEHLHHVFGDELRRRLVRIALFAIQIAESLERRGRIEMAGRRHAPGTNRCTDQCALARRGRQPTAEHPLVERLENQSFGAAGGCRDNRNVLRAQAVLTQVRERLGAGMEIEGNHAINGDPVQRARR
jgi:hypothetical protein